MAALGNLEITCMEGGVQTSDVHPDGETCNGISATLQANRINSKPQGVGLPLAAF